MMRQISEAPCWKHLGTNIMITFPASKIQQWTPPSLPLYLYTPTYSSCLTVDFVFSSSNQQVLLCHVAPAELPAGWVTFHPPRQAKTIRYLQPQRSRCRGMINSVSSLFLSKAANNLLLIFDPIYYLLTDRMLSSSKITCPQAKIQSLEDKSKCFLKPRCMIHITKLTTELWFQEKQWQKTVAYNLHWQHVFCGLNHTNSDQSFLMHFCVWLALIHTVQVKELTIYSKLLYS